MHCYVAHQPVRARVYMRGLLVNQALLEVLLIWLLIASAIWMTTLALRQIAINVKAIRKLVGTIKEGRVHTFHKKLENHVELIGKEVEPIFELWWADIGKKTAENSPSLIDNLNLPFDISQLPEQVQAIIKAQALARAADSVREFAVHLATTANHLAFIQEVRRVSSTMADEVRAEYDEHIEAHRSELVRLGIDIDDFERRFTSS